MRGSVVVLAVALCACRGRGADDVETVNGTAGSFTEPDPAGADGSLPDGSLQAPDPDPERWPVVEPLVRDGQRACPETHRFPEWAGYYQPATGCQGGGIAFCWGSRPSSLAMPATVVMIDTSGTCWAFRNTPLFFPRGWRDATRDDCQPASTEVDRCPSP